MWHNYRRQSTFSKIDLDISLNWIPIDSGIVCNLKVNHFKIITCFIFISDLTNLVELDLSYNFLSAIPVGALADLNNLKFLNLGSNKIQVKFISPLQSNNIYMPFYVSNNLNKRKNHWKNKHFEDAKLQFVYWKQH